MIGNNRNPRVKRGARFLYGNENSVLVFVLIGIVAVLAGVTRGVSVTRENVSSIMLRSSTIGIASVGQLFVVLTAGIDISVGGLAAFSMCLGGLLMTGPEAGVTGILSEVTIPWGAGILVALLIGMGIGAANGTLVSRLRMPPLIVTLAMWIITRGGATAITRGARVYHIPETLVSIGQGKIAGVPLPFVFFITIAVITYLVLNHTTFGKSVYAVGGNPASAWLSGIATNRIRFQVYIISGFLAALTGALIMARSNVAAAISVGSLELDTIAAVAIGGVSLFGGEGGTLGVVLGVLILGVISNGMNVMRLGAAAQDTVRGQF
jgi:ribose/xylose/arabinose/galactoside ABC-type transport system permease subunit